MDQLIQSGLSSIEVFSYSAQLFITLRFIQAGKPQQNGCIEQYNRTMRYDCLGQRYLIIYTYHCY
ncbi:transposase [Salmonella enterica]|nr:transposase [Salmonella enterica]EGB1971790.1 transposase [Salmonella enterica]